MPKKSVRENKTIYQESREAAEMTIAEASEATNISDSSISRIEAGDKIPQPDEVLAMAAAYKDPNLCNTHCSKNCEIGREHVPEIKRRHLSQIVLEMLASLNSLNNQRDRLIEITADGVIEDGELNDFVAIQNQLDEISATIDSLKLWVERTVLSNKINADKLKELRNKKR